jgi:hypothetical protein
MLISFAGNRFRRSLIASLLLVLLRSGFAQDSFTLDAKHFDYDSDARLYVKELSAKSHDGVSIHRITYASLKGGRDSASLIVPQGKGKFAVILWGHWMMPHSPVANWQEFLEEAIALTPAGVVSLLQGLCGY